MKTARFAQIVAQVGKPTVYLPLIEPRKDAALQKLAKNFRVLTVHQTFRGGTDFGEVGLHPGENSQLLVFPRSLKRFAERRIVGIHYELFEEKLEPGATPELAKFPAASSAPRSRSAAAPKSGRSAPAQAAPPAEVVPFQAPQPEEDPEPLTPEETLRELRRVLALLRRKKLAAARDQLAAVVDRLARAED